MRTNGSVSTYVDASPVAVYDVVSDVTRTGEWSPECHRCEWRSTARGVGARFKGWNRAGRFGWARWARVCEVIEAEPGRVFAFRTVPSVTKRDSTTWRFEMAADGSGTRLTESYEITMMPPRLFQALIGKTLPHHFDMRPHMDRTVAALKAAAESDRNRAPTAAVS